MAVNDLAHDVQDGGFLQGLLLRPEVETCDCLAILPSEASVVPPLSNLGNMVP